MLYNSVVVRSLTDGMSSEAVVLKRMCKVWSVVRSYIGLKVVGEENQGGSW